AQPARAAPAVAPRGGHFGGHPAGQDRLQAAGRILDLSMSGCRIRTDERFPVGIYTRIEIEFRLEGLPFRLGGVIQAIHDRFHIGIRFLDMSPRKQGQVEQLIEEMREMRERQEPGAAPGDETGSTMGAGSPQQANGAP
ncbi:MAG: PilZ domain-containing protein, partial [Terracidiphilus sp.]